ncbi:hypothetical protein JWJ90_21485 [Desulfobulbus rhabdoformis]|uniref:hypothetical protein n=1 Tax=Desulfobulbus rhabdoformis TaxID=34032 RepID=UPI0019627047|nr:hypothetical protein [Desulfobulbus rhabdoformis]MBM9616840.1 hypothetical protein [Desulfobulbus rhabdoformis]
MDQRSVVFAVSPKWSTVSFNEAFTITPVVITTIAMENEFEAISGRIKDATTTTFSYYFREQEKNVNKHAEETVHYLAWEPGTSSLGDMQYWGGATATGARDAWSTITFPSAGTDLPLLLADMQTTADVQPAAIRMQNLSATGVEVKVEEEQSKDMEVTHSEEIVGYIALSQKVSEKTVLATFNWEFDADQESNISGFQILANG